MGSIIGNLITASLLSGFVAFLFGDLCLCKMSAPDKIGISWVILAFGTAVPAIVAVMAMSAAWQLDHLVH